ncbi:MAG TPA: prevent-host-death protein, partial [Thermoanaerobacter sp.]|nr:prevent-host-death protein [Thermoanaerobacter sp.]
MKTIPVTTVRQNIYKILEQIIVSNEPIQITSKKGNAVL